MKLLKLSLMLVLTPALLNATECTVDRDCENGYKCYGDNQKNVCCKPNSKDSDSPSCDCLKQDNKTTATEIKDLPSWCRCGQGKFGKLPNEILLDKKTGKTTCCSSKQLKGNVCKNCKPHKLPDSWCATDKPSCKKNGATNCQKYCECPSGMNCCTKPQRWGETQTESCCTIQPCNSFWSSEDCSII